MIFQILEIRKMASEAKANPGKFASGQAGSMFLDLLVIPAIITLVPLGIFFLFGFTSFLGGPYLFFRVLFFLTLSALFFVIYFLLKIYKFIKSVTKKTVEGALKVKSTVVNDEKNS